jgi:riboflavin kinase/FMN adenylyltransferase
VDVYNNWQGIKNKYKNLVVGLGNFDGVHRGHQKLIAELISLSHELDGTPAVFTFHPHPQAVLDPENSPPLLLSPKAKQEIMAGLGIKVLLIVPFNLDFARLSPEDFIKQVLHEELGLKGVVVGYDYTFGYRGRGTPSVLEAYAPVYGYKVRVIQPVAIDGQVISSTLIRCLLSQGEIAEAAKYLGYGPFVEGQVVTGDKRGSVLGFPTANLNIEQDVLVPANGVYAVKVSVNGNMFLGVANIGTKPTFQGKRRNIEVHLLDFYQDLYGSLIRVTFIRRLRQEKRFETPDDLVKQIERDIAQVKAGCSEMQE